MTGDTTITKVYLKPGCPFCLKLRIFLLEAGLLDRLVVHQFVEGSEDEAAIRAELASHFEKVGFPTAKLRSGTYLAESDAIIAHMVAETGADPTHMPTLRAYADGVMPRMMAMFRENMQLKQRHD